MEFDVLRKCSVDAIPMEMGYGVSMDSPHDFFIKISKFFVFCRIMNEWKCIVLGLCKFGSVTLLRDCDINAPQVFSEGLY